MAIYAPQPVPTPFQPIGQGGNPYLSQTNQVLGEYIPKTAVPVGNDSGSIGFSNNVRVPINQTQNLPVTIQGVQGPAPQPQAPSGFDMSKYVGWDETAARADFVATGGPQGGGGSPAPAPLPTFNIKGSSYTGNPLDVAKQVNPNTDFGQYATQFDNDPSKFYAQIDADAQAQLAFLDKQQSALDEAKAQFGQQIEADYNLNLSKGTASKEKAVSTLGQNQVTAEQRKQDALNTARQLYDQLQTGYRQRFGGATSAGEAAQSILGTEQQRQSGTIGRDYLNTVAQIESQKADVENQFETLIQDLDYQKQRSTSEALMNYQTNMRSIDADRMQTEQGKSQAKMQILMQLRDTQNQIAANDRAYRQQLDAAKQQAQMQLDMNLKQMQQQVALNTQAGGTALSNFQSGTQNIQSNLGQNNTVRSASTQQSQPNALSTAVGQMYNPQSQNMTFEERMRLGL